MKNNLKLYKFSDNNVSCTTCPAGYYCEGGTYNLSGGNVGLSPCPSGYQDGGTGLTSRSDCVKSVSRGYRVATANGSATTCSATTYSNDHTVKYESTSSCTSCAIGTYAAAGSGACSNCSYISNATFTSNGSLANNCEFSCNSGYSKVGRACTKAPECTTVGGTVYLTTAGGYGMGVFNCSAGAGMPATNSCSWSACKGETVSITHQQYIKVSAYGSPVSNFSGSVNPGSSTFIVNGNGDISITASLK